MSKWFKFLNKDNGQSGEIYIYGAIVDQIWSETDPETAPLDFKEALDKLKDAKRIDVYVNSPGGNVFAGLAIYNMLKRNTANKVGHVDGIAASISSVILMACNTIEAPKTTMMLAHKPLIAGYIFGNANDLRKVSEDLDKCEEVIVNAYVEKTGLKAQKIREIMEKDSYMTGEEAVKFGFADSLGDGKNYKASIEDGSVVVNGQSLDLKNYKDFPIDKFKNLFIENVVVPEEPPIIVPPPIDYSKYENELNLINTF